MKFYLYILLLLSGVPLYVCNEENYGYIMVPLEEEQGLDYDQVQLTNIKLEALGKELG